MRIDIHDTLKGTPLLKEGMLWGRETGAAFYKLIHPRIQAAGADVVLLNFDSIQMIEMNFAVEAFTGFAMQRVPGKTVFVEGIHSDSRQNIEAALRPQQLVLPLYENGRITFIGHLQPHLQAFWEEIQGEASLQAPALAQRLGKSTGRINDSLRVFHRLGVL